MVVGATSAIAEATARILAARGDHLYLVGRSPQRLQAIADDLRVRGCPHIGFEALDANDLPAHPAALARAEAALGSVDSVLIAHGTLPDQVACQESVERTLAEVKTNALSVLSLLTLVANRFEQRRGGTIAVIASVAGDRGRASNYVYGSAKAMVIAFLSGLRQRLARSGVSVVTIKPGFVDTPMTAAFRKGILWATPELVAVGIVRAMDRGRPEAYLPWFWRWIMAVVVHIPERVFARLRM
jgi:decaprenylphospho-beta-D-erythro-pentofuranosid-2-ulose 2-reductase